MPIWLPSVLLTASIWVLGLVGGLIMRRVNMARTEAVQEARHVATEKRVTVMELAHAQLETRLAEVAEEIRDDLKVAIKEFEAAGQDRHNRMRHTLNNMNQQLLLLVEDRGRNDARHDENRRVLDTITRRLERLDNGHAR